MEYLPTWPIWNLSETFCIYSGEPQNVALIKSYGESRNVKFQTDLSEPEEEPSEIKKLSIIYMTIIIWSIQCKRPKQVP
jgi:hypothetical protein